MKLTKKIVSLFILGLLLLPVAGRMVQASEESQLYDVDITYIFDGENANVDADLVDQVYGSTFGLTPVSAYAGYVWAYWIVNGVVRYDLPQNHSFRVTRNLVLQGVFAPEGKHTVVFLDSNGQLIESQFVDNNDTVTPPNVDNKSKPGLQVSATTPWRTSTGAVFNPAVGITSNMVIILQYETTVLGTYLMTVNGVEEGPYNFNQLVSVTADAEDLDETPFSHWEENGVMVSRNLNYVFTAVKDRTLTAVYSNTPSADLPLVVLTRDIELRSGYHTYIGQFYLPEGYEIVEYGFLIDNVNTLDLSKSNADYVVPAPSYTEASNEYVMSFPIGSHLNVRAYFTHKVGGSVLTVYSDENPRYIDELSYSFNFGTTGATGYAPTTRNFTNLITNQAVELNMNGTQVANTAGKGVEGAYLVMNPAASTASPIKEASLYLTMENIFGIDFDVVSWASGEEANLTKAELQLWNGTTYVTIKSFIGDIVASTPYGFTSGALSSGEYRIHLETNGTTNARVIIDNLEIYTLYTGLTNSLTYNVDGIESYEIVKRNVPISQPSNPAKTGYTFDAWYLEDTFVTPYNFANNVTTDLTLYAKFNINQYTIAFNSNGGSAVTSIVQNYNTEVLEPASPTKDGYLFDDWYSDVELTTPYVFDTMPAQNITLYAKWTLDSYDITYMLDGGTNNGSNPATYTIETSTITLLAATKDGFTFNGWYDNAGFTGDPISEIAIGSFGDVTLYAKFTENTGITFDVLVYDFEGDGNQLLYTIEVAENGFATRPGTDPTRAGYRFDDWYLDNAETPFNWATTAIVEDITIFGVWVQTFTVTFDSNQGSEVDQQVVDINGYATEPSPMPTKNGFDFVGWFDEELLIEFDFQNTSIVSHVILYAKWIQINQITITQSSSNLTSTSYDSGAERLFSLSSYNFGAIYTLKSSTNIQGQANTMRIYNLSSLPRIKSIVITLTGSSAHTVYAGTIEKPVTTSISASISGLVYTYDFTAGNYSYFNIANNTNAIYIVSIVLNYYSE